MKIWFKMQKQMISIWECVFCHEA